MKIGRCIGVPKLMCQTYVRPMRPEDILLPTPAGVCCKRGGFFIDPTRAVDKALITHGHSDHARAGHGSVLATTVHGLLEDPDVVHALCGMRVRDTIDATFDLLADAVEAHLNSRLLERLTTGS